MKRLLIAVFASFIVTLCSAQRETGLADEDTSYKSTSLILLPSSKADLPRSVDLRPYCPMAKDQGKISSCVGWAVGYGLMTIQKAIDEQQTDTKTITENAFSALFIYNQVKSSEGTCLSSSVMSSALEFIQEKGNCLSREFDFKVDDCYIKPEDKLKIRARNNVIAGYGRLFDQDAKEEMKIEFIRKVLAQNKPVSIGLKINKYFMTLREVDYWDPNLGKTPDFTHAMVIVGYDDDAGCFTLFNSWGRSWGQNGFIKVKYRDIGKYCNFAFAIQLSKNSSSIQPLVMTENGFQRPQRQGLVAQTGSTNASQNNYNGNNNNQPQGNTNVVNNNSQNNRPNNQPQGNANVANNNVQNNRPNNQPQGNANVANNNTQNNRPNNQPQGNANVANNNSQNNRPNNQPQGNQNVANNNRPNNQPQGNQNVANNNRPNNQPQGNANVANNNTQNGRPNNQPQVATATQQPQPTEKLTSKEGVPDDEEMAAPPVKELVQMDGGLEVNHFTGNFTDTGEPVFQTLGVEQVGNHYAILKKDWQVGDAFQLALTSNISGAYVYIVSINPRNEVKIMFPRNEEFGRQYTGLHESPLMMLDGARALLPRSDKVMKVDYVGTDRICVLFSTRKITGFPIFCQKIQQWKGNFDDYLHSLLGDLMVPMSDTNLSLRKIGFSVSTRTDGVIVPIVIEFKSQ